jgi:DNA-binding Lrp family transcriptional regulator
MSAKTNPKGKVIEKEKEKGLRKLSFAELASMFHGLLFAYEKVFMDLYGADAPKLYPYLIDELAHLLHSGDDPIIDDSKTMEENIDRVMHFISNEEYVMDVNFKKTDENKYLFNIGACSFAKSGVHDILKIKDGICPFGLVIASCLTELNPNGYVKVTKTEFDDEGSKTYMESVSVIESGGGSPLAPISEIDDEIFSIPAISPPIDEMDLKIIKELRKDGRQSNVDLAKKLDTSESTVRRRIDNLVERGLIRGFTTLLRYNPKDTFLRAFIGIKVEPTHMESVVSKLTKMKETCSVYKTLGKHNLICETMFNSRAKFQSFIDDLQYTEGIVDVHYSIGSSAPKPCPWYGF